MNSNPREALLQWFHDQPPGKAYTLAESTIVKRASDYARQGRVSQFEWKPDGSLTATVSGEMDYTVRLALRKETLHTTCTCPHSHEGYVCKHQVATVMTGFRLFRGTSYWREREMGDSHWNALRKQVLNPQPPSAPKAKIKDANQSIPPTKPDSGVKGKVRVSPSTGGRGIRLQYYQGNKPVPLWGPYPRDIEIMMRTVPGSEMMLRHFQQWFESGAGGYEVEAEGVEGKVVPLKSGPFLPCRASLELHPHEDQVQVRRMLQLPQGEVITGFHTLGLPLVLLTEQATLGRVENPEGWKFQLTFDRYSTFLGSYFPSDQPVEIDATDFNFSGLLHTKKTDRPAPKLFTRTGKISHPEITPTQTCICIEEEEEDWRVWIELRAFEVSLPHAASAMECAVEMVENPQNRPFFAASARAQAFAEYAGQMMLARNVTERNLILERAGLDSIFERSEKTEFALRLLRKLWKATGQDRTRTVHFREEQELENPWFVVEGGVNLAAQAAGLVWSFLGSLPGDCSEMPLIAPLAQWESQISPLVKEATARGIRVEFEGDSVESMPARITVQAVRSDDLDWFELKPEVTCEGFTVPQDQWDRVMGGGMFEGADGKRRVLVLDHPEALERLREMLRMREQNGVGSKKKGGKKQGEIMRVPRLRMLDWLALSKLGVECQMPKEDAVVLKSLLEFESIAESPLPQGLKAELRDYQKRGYDWLAFLYQHRFGACLADDMGLGKTLQTICLLGGIKEGRVPSLAPRETTGPHLIVLPPTLLFNWRSEIETFFPSLRVSEYSGKDRSLNFAHADVVLTSYELARRDMDVLEKHPFHVAVFDEAQAVKNLLGARSQAMRRIQARFRLCLTGTPMENHVGEYFSILELAVPGVFGDLKEFHEGMKKGGRILERARPFVLRRTKERILKELPPKVESDTHLDLSDSQKEYYTRAVAEVRAEVLEAYRDKPSQQAGIMALSALMRLRQICISPAILDPSQKERSPKLEHLVTQLTELAQEGHAALVFSQFTRALDLVQLALTEESIPYQRMDGSTPTSKRKDLVGRFQDPKGPGVFLISLKTGGAGLNLTRASYVFHLDPWWNPAVENQASDRAHRMGQKQTVFIQRLLMRHTVEEKMMELKRRKQELFQQVLEGAETRGAGGAITREDFQFLLD